MLLACKKSQLQRRRSNMPWTKLTRFRFHYAKRTVNDKDGENACPWGLGHRWLVLLAEWQCSSHWRPTDLAKPPPDGIVNPVTFGIDLFGFSSFRFGSLFLFFCHLGHACTSAESSYPLDDENRQKDSDLGGGIFAAILVPLISRVRFRLSWVPESPKDAGFWSR